MARRLAVRQASPLSAFDHSSVSLEIGPPFESQTSIRAIVWRGSC